jgi:hypothetical protein
VHLDQNVYSNEPILSQTPSLNKSNSAQTV